MCVLVEPINTTLWSSVSLPVQVIVVVFPIIIMSQHSSVLLVCDPLPADAEVSFVNPLNVDLFSTLCRAFCPEPSDRSNLFDVSPVSAFDEDDVTSFFRTSLERARFNRDTQSPDFGDHCHLLFLRASHGPMYVGAISGLAVAEPTTKSVRFAATQVLDDQPDELFSDTSKSESYPPIPDARITFAVSATPPPPNNENAVYLEDFSGPHHFVCEASQVPCTQFPSLHSDSLLGSAGTQLLSQ